MGATLNNLQKLAGNKWVHMALFSGFVLYAVLRH
jgi:hypothetical protein